MSSRGVFITFEGGDGVGKSTQLSILADALAALGREVVRLREPGGTPMGERLRALVLDPALAPVSDACELYLYEAARAQLVAQRIRPALERGAVVLCDRFADSTTAYQAFGRGLDIEEVRRANAFACQGTEPDRTILLSLPAGEGAEGLARAAHDHAADRLEQAGEAFQERVLAGFARIAAADPQRVRTVDAGGTRGEVARRVSTELADLLPELSRQGEASLRANGGD